MRNHANEIRSLISRLTRTGEYDRFAGALADQATAEVNEMLAQALELDDEQVNALWAQDVGSARDLAQQEHEERARRAAGALPATGRSEKEVMRSNPE